MGLRRNIRNAFDTIIADVCGSETYLPENKKPYTKKSEERLLCKEQDTRRKERRTENTAVHSADTVSMRITPNGPYGRPTNSKEDPYNGII